MRTHLHRSDRSTWCGRDIRTTKFGHGIRPEFVTRDLAQVTCLACIKADKAETRREVNANS
jgi:hypothetical protein